MKRCGHLLPLLCMALMGSSISTGIAAETAVEIQDLVSVKVSNKFDRVVWLRGPIHYSLQFIPVRSNDTARPANPAITAANQGAPGTPDRSSFFIGNTIANLRGAAPVIDPPRILTMIDGRRVVAGQVVPAPRIQVWLLRADGTLILPTWDARYKLFSVPTAEAVQAIAAAIRIDDQYYIEKLQSMEPKPAVQ